MRHFLPVLISAYCFLGITALAEEAVTASSSSLAIPSNLNITYTDTLKTELSHKETASKIQTGDMLTVVINYSDKYFGKVEDDGFLKLKCIPLINQFTQSPQRKNYILKAEGLLVEQLQQNLQQLPEFRKLSVDVTLQPSPERKKIKVTLFGAVQNNKIIEMDANSTVRDVLEKHSGGFLLGADLKRIEIHNDKTGKITPIWLAQFSEYENDSLNNDNVIKEPLKKLKPDNLINKKIATKKPSRVDTFVESFRKPTLIKNDITMLLATVDNLNNTVNEQLKKHSQSKISLDSESAKNDNLCQFLNMLKSASNFLKALEEYPLAELPDNDIKALKEYFSIQGLMIDEIDNSNKYQQSTIEKNSLYQLKKYYPLIRSIALTCIPRNLSHKLKDGDIIEIPAIRTLELAKRDGLPPLAYLYQSSPLLPLRDYALFNNNIEITVVGEVAEKDGRVDKNDFTMNGSDIGVNLAKQELKEEQTIKTANGLISTQTTIDRKIKSIPVQVPVGTDVLGAIQLAGGYTLQASRNRVYILRKDPTDFQMKNLGRVLINEWNILPYADSRKRYLSQPVSPGDIIYVAPYAQYSNPWARFGTTLFFRTLDAAAQTGGLITTGLILRK